VEIPETFEQIKTRLGRGLGSLMASSTFQPSEKVSGSRGPGAAPKQPFNVVSELEASKPEWEAPSAVESEEEESGDEMEAKEEGSEEEEEEESGQDEEESEDEESSGN
jgi:hypothetical protein